MTTINLAFISPYTPPSNNSVNLSFYSGLSLVVNSVSLVESLSTVALSTQNILAINK